MYTRRDFIKLSSIMALYSGGIFSLSPTRLKAANIPDDGKYRAIVYIMLHGGNDGFNMFIPNETNAYANYKNIRNSISVSNTNLTLPNFVSQSISSNPYNDIDESSAYLSGSYNIGLDLSVNGVMPELAYLVKNGNAKIISNIGNLVFPTTKENISSVELPKFLFAHNYQMQQIEIGRADQVTGTGWAGQIADKWFGGEFDSSYPFGLNVSMIKNNNMMLGEKTSPLVMTTSGPVKFQQIDSDRYFNRRAFFKYLSGESISAGGVSTNPVPLDFTGKDNISNNYIESTYQKFNNKSLDVLNELETNWNEVKSTLSYSLNDSYGNSLFSIPNSSNVGWNITGTLIEQLDAIATMIKMGKEKGFGRQVFVAHLSGFDTHSNMADNHPVLLRELSLGLHKFHTAMTEKGLIDNVVTTTMSEFGRTVSNNGDGTDHGWGNHQIVMGGGMSTPEIIGEIPDLTLGGVDDYSDKGRIIPKIATEQLNATICKWFGVTNTELNDIFPNLKNFQTGSTLDSALIDNLFS